MNTHRTTTALTPIPEAALDDRLAFVGTSGSGKTFAAKGRVETLLDRGHRVVIVDPLDVWWGLRVYIDGTTQAHAVRILGGKHGDMAEWPKDLRARQFPIRGADGEYQTWRAA